MFLLCLGALGLLVRSTREWAMVEQGEQASPKPIMSEEVPKSRGKYGLLVGVIGILVAGPIMNGISSSTGDDPVDVAIANHQSVSLATGKFFESADIAAVREALVAQGLSPGLATAHDLSDAHLTLEGGIRLAGDLQAGAFRYRHGSHVYVLQSYADLQGGGTTQHSRHIGHNLMRGYEGIGASAAVWSDNGNVYVFSGQGSMDDILDLAASAFYGMKSGGSHH
jgi:hypothetical protein